ncbi:MAG: hypothetical protein IJP43_04535, partial [Oscillospiraceae bacterium]|nr:hypothetical protein [Oscillospiraceae bacterium]
FNSRLPFSRHTSLSGLIIHKVLSAPDALYDAKNSARSVKAFNQGLVLFILSITQSFKKGNKK